MKQNYQKHHLIGKTLAILSCLAFYNEASHANGLYRNGVGAQAMSMGGTDTAWADNPLGAMGDNPAGLGFLEAPEFDLGGVGGVTEGSFHKGDISSGALKSSPNGLPEGAFGMPLGDLPVSVGLSVIPDSFLLADWHYIDPPGGLNGTTTYGYQEDKSEIIVLRSALGAAVKINSQLSFGASLGLIYNENHLHTPYIFQNLSGSDAAFNGAKTMLNLETSGFGWNVESGLIYRATTNLQFGAFYRSEATVNTSGNANGDPSTQFGQPQGTLPFHYDAEVKNKFPQSASLGVSWKFHPQWRAALQLDWINWGGAFESLPVGLSHGNNATVNSVLGSHFSDSIPLNWSDEFVYRAGLEYDVTENLALRFGYSYGQSPVPSSTLTPMTAAIMEHTLTAGIGYQWKHIGLDLAYQFDLPVTRNVGANDLRAGEYTDSSTEVAIHTLALTARIKF